MDQDEDIWRLFDITHRKHIICNPLDSSKLDQIVSLFNLEQDSSVLEFACGKGEFIIRLAEQYRINGIALDLSPYHLADAVRARDTRVPDCAVTFLEMDGADFAPEPSRRFDLVACLGASWIYGSLRGTLAAMVDMASPDAWIVVGDSFWQRPPSAEYLELINEEQDSYGTHYDNARLGDECGLELVHTVASSFDEWDKYEGLKWLATEEWAHTHPDDPDRSMLLNHVRRNRKAYLKWGRDTQGWAVYVFRKRGTEPSALE